MRILHTADLHIGDRRYGRFDSARHISTRLDDQARCLSHIAEVAIEERADATIIAGDIYHGRSPSPAEEDVFAAFIARLVGAGIEVFAIIGNHERSHISGSASPLTHIETLGLERFHLLSDYRVETVEIGGKLLSVAALPWPFKRELVEEGIIASGKSPTPLDWERFIKIRIEELATQIPDGSTAILAAHLWTSNVAGLNPTNLRGEPVCSAGTLAVAPFRYIALGHIHAHQQVWGEPPALYSGGIDRGDFSEMRDPKGAIIVDIEEDTTSWRFFETPARRFVKIELDICGASDPAELVVARAKAFHLDDAIVKIVVHQSRSDPPLDTRRLKPKLPETFFLTVVRQIEDVRPRSGVSYSGDFLDALAEYIEQSEEYKPFKENLLELAKAISEEVSS